jgi:mRNA-degrading endonuclease RelE of RelBE toxin-antitoxin system
VAYRVEITPEGLRHLNRLPTKVRAAVLEAVFGTIAENPQRAGKALRGELEGLYSARRGDFRIVYEIDARARVVLIHRAQLRRTIYHPR